MRPAPKKKLTQALALALAALLLLPPLTEIFADNAPPAPPAPPLPASSSGSKDQSSSSSSQKSSSSENDFNLDLSLDLEGPPKEKKESSSSSSDSSSSNERSADGLDLFSEDSGKSEQDEEASSDLENPPEEAQWEAGEDGNTPKDEIVYVSMAPDGQTKGIYVVNSFNLDSDQTITDYGKYSRITNLTNMKEMQRDGERITVDAQEGQFFYQGDNPRGELPWDIEVDYRINGKSMRVEEMGGQKGEVEIYGKVTPNPKANEAYTKYYLAQVSLSFDTRKVHITDPSGAEVAYAGSTETLNFLVMPEESLQFVIKLDTENFAMDGITVGGIPFNIKVDLPDTDKMTEGLKKFEKAISALNAGAENISKGGTALNESTMKLYKGVKEIQEGIHKSVEGQKKIVDASQKFNEGMAKYDEGVGKAISQLTDGAKQLTQLKEGLGKLQDGSNKLTDGMTKYKTGLTEYTGGVSKISASMKTYSEGMNKIAEASDKITSGGKQIKEGISDAQKLASSLDDFDINQQKESIEMAKAQVKGLRDTIDSLSSIDMSKLKSLNLNDKDAQLVNGILKGFQENIQEKLGKNLDQAENNLDEMSKTMEKIDPDQIKKNAQMLDQLDEYVDGVNAVMGGVKQLSAGASKISDGLQQLDGKKSELTGGMDQLITSEKAISSGLKQMVDGLSKQSTANVDQLTQLKTGIDTILSNDRRLLEGQKDLGKGLKELSDGMDKYVNGFEAYHKGVEKFTGGIDKLADGTKEMEKQSSGMSNKATEEIDKVMEKFTRKGFRMVSFVSPKNHRINLVQFAYSSNPIIAKAEAPEAKKEQEKTFFQKIVSFFKRG